MKEQNLTPEYIEASNNYCEAIAKGDWDAAYQYHLELYSLDHD